MHEEEILGKAYDARLIRRIWGYTRPHGRLVALSVLLFPLVTGLELLQPYLVKVAIEVLCFALAAFSLNFLIKVGVDIGFQLLTRVLTECNRRQSTKT